MDGKLKREKEKENFFGVCLVGFLINIEYSTSINVELRVRLFGGEIR